MVLEPRPRSRRHGPDCGLVALLVPGRPAWSVRLHWGQEVSFHWAGRRVREAVSQRPLLPPARSGCLHAAKQAVYTEISQGSHSPALPCLPGSRQTLPMGLRPARSSH